MSDKTPGAMVLVRRDLIGNAIDYMEGSQSAKVILWREKLIDAVEQTPAVGGEPETVAWMYLLHGGKNALFSTNELEKQGGIALCRVGHVAPLLAEIERLKGRELGVKEEVFDIVCKERDQFKARITELEKDTEELQRMRRVLGYRGMAGIQEMVDNMEDEQDEQ